MIILLLRYYSTSIIIILIGFKSRGVGTDFMFLDVVEMNKQVGHIMPDRCPLRIVGGVDIPITYAPYQVAIVFNNGRTWRSFCGGSLITYNHVLTAAHCFADHMKLLHKYMDRFEIVAGTSRSYARGTRRRGGGPTEKWTKIKDYYQHKFYNSKSLQYDVGVAVLKSTLSQSSAIKPIRMHTEDLNLDLPTNTLCSASGYGHLTYGGPPTNQLQMVCLGKERESICKSVYKDKFTNRNLCAYAWGKDTCQGDSGGPIVCNGVLAGITSYGYGCGLYAGVYAKVIKHTTGNQPFIKDGNVLVPKYITVFILINLLIVFS